MSRQIGGSAPSINEKQEGNTYFQNKQENTYQVQSTSSSGRNIEKGGSGSGSASENNIRE